MEVTGGGALLQEVRGGALILEVMGGGGVREGAEVLTWTCGAWLMTQGRMKSCSAKAFSSSTVSLVRLRGLSTRSLLL